MLHSRLTVTLTALLLTTLAIAPPALASGRSALGQTLVSASGTISRPGAYLRTRDLSTNGAEPLFTIASDGVTLNLNGHTLSGPGQKTGVGILVRGVSGTRLSGGRIASFGTAVQVEDAQNVVVDGIQIEGNDLGGPPPAIEIGVLILNSRGVVVTENVVTGTFLGVFVRGAGSGGNRIFANTLTGGANGQLGICYNPAPGLSDWPSGDLVYQNVVSRWNVGIQTSDASAGNVFRENAIAYFDTDVDERTDGSNIFSENDAVQIAP